MAAAKPWLRGNCKNNCKAFNRDRFQADSVILQKEEDEAYGLHQFVEIRQELHEINKKSPDFMLAYLRQKLFHDYHRMDALMHKKRSMSFQPSMQLYLSEAIITVIPM